MALSRKKTGPVLSRAEALAAVPMRNPSTRELLQEDGTVMLVIPVLVRPWFVRLAQRLGSNVPEVREKKLKLDELGTYVWGLVDGKKSVTRIIEVFCKKYQLEKKEAEVAVTAFLRSLGGRGLVAMK